MKKKTIAVFCIALCMMITSSVAQEIEEQYGYGLVKEFVENQLVVLEWADEQEQEVDVVYVIDKDTSFENVDETGLMTEEEVEVYFYEQDGKKVATMVSKFDDIPEFEQEMQADVIEEERVEIDVEIPAVDAEIY